jgi:hypothetical protein
MTGKKERWRDVWNIKKRVWWHKKEGSHLLWQQQEQMLQHVGQLS